MTLTRQQLWIATKIDTRMQRLIRAGKDNLAIMGAMADHMPAFHQLLNTTEPDGLDQLTRKFSGFRRYAKILESLAAGIQSGAIPVPGPNEAPRQVNPVSDHHQLAAAIDLRMRQLAEEGVPHAAIIERMVGYVADLGKIWNSTTGEQLAALCREYPGFHTYAALMEQAAGAERQKPARAYDGLPELPDPLKEHLSSLLSTAAKLERDYQSVLDATGPTAPASWLRPLDTLHAQWQADLTRFRAAIQCAGVPQASREVVLPVLEHMARQIAELEARIHTS